MSAESPQTFNNNKDNRGQLTHDTHSLSVRQYWSLCGHRQFSVKQGVSRQCALVGSENCLFASMTKVGNQTVASYNNCDWSLFKNVQKLPETHETNQSKPWCLSDVMRVCRNKAFE